MEDQQSSPDWLPAGWTTEVKVRKNGKKDRCFTDPSNGLKFFSKLDVLRHLNNVEINHPRSEKKKKGNRKRSAVNFVVEKAVAEGLPPGWIKEMRVKKKGRKIRRDPYYIDPVSGFVFRSMKDVVRYLETGDLGRLASKPKDKGHIAAESTTGSEGQKLADNGTDIQVTSNQSSKLGVVVKDAQILEFNCTRDCIPFSEHTSDQGREGIAMSSVNMPEANGLKQREGKGDSSICMLVAAPVVGAPAEKLPLENGVEKRRKRKIQRGKNKLNEEKGPDLPRRASKRLAGLRVNSLLEPKTNNRACQVAARRSGEAEANTAENLDTPEEHSEKVGKEIMVDEKQGCPIVLPLGNLSIPEAHAGQVETDNKGDEKTGSPLDFSLRDSWMDPCIEFAIKTLTGAIPIGDENKTDGNLGSPQNLPDQNPGSGLVLPYGDSWTDPCIEFAVKTLTGEIPVGEDLGIQDYFQQQLSSSETQRSNGLMSPNVGLDNFCRANFEAADKPPYTQQALVGPILPHTGNVHFQNAGGVEEK